jgi:hypothetical protein
MAFAKKRPYVLSVRDGLPFLLCHTPPSGKRDSNS